MTRALRNGSAALEFDLHVTSDGHLVLHHDPVVEVDGRTVRIAESDLEDLRAVQPNLATVCEVLTAFPGVPLTVEVKAPKAAELAARTLRTNQATAP